MPPPINFITLILQEYLSFRQEEIAFDRSFSMVGIGSLRSVSILKTYPHGRYGFIFDYGIPCLALVWCGKALANSATRVMIRPQIPVKPRRILRRGLIHDHIGHNGHMVACFKARCFL